MNGWILRAGAALLLTSPVSAAPDVATLRAQLSQAEKSADSLASIELMRRILDLQSTDDALHRRLIEQWLELPDYDLAEATLTAWPGAPADLTALTRAEVRRFRDRDTAGAIRILREYLAQQPRDVTAHRALVSALLATDDAKAQLAALDSLIELAPDASALIQRAHVRLRLGDYPAAIADARTAETRNPDANEVKASLPAFERLEETLAALPSLDAALARDPRDPARLVERAWWLRYGGLFSRSLADADAALAVSPQSVAALVTRDRARYLLDQLKAEDALREDLVDVNRAHSLESILAVAEADKLLAAKPGNPAALRQRARALNGTEQFSLARRDGLAALETSPKDAAAALEVLSAVTRLNEDPAPVLRRLERMNPDKNQLALAHAWVADVYLRESKIPLALEFADRSLGFAESAPTLRLKAAALQRLGRPDEARAATDRANALTP